MTGNIGRSQHGISTFKDLNTSSTTDVVILPQQNMVFCTDADAVPYLLVNKAKSDYQLSAEL